MCELFFFFFYFSFSLIIFSPLAWFTVILQVGTVSLVVRVGWWFHLQGCAYVPTQYILGLTWTTYSLFYLLCRQLLNLLIKWYYYCGAIIGRYRFSYGSCGLVVSSSRLCLCTYLVCSRANLNDLQSFLFIMQVTANLLVYYYSCCWSRVLFSSFQIRFLRSCRQEMAVDVNASFACKTDDCSASGNNRG